MFRAISSGGGDCRGWFPIVKMAVEEVGKREDTLRVPAEWSSFEFVWGYAGSGAVLLLCSPDVDFQASL